MNISIWLYLAHEKYIYCTIAILEKIQSASIDRSSSNKDDFNVWPTRSY
jgi:hypothetical protein